MSHRWVKFLSVAATTLALSLLLLGCGGTTDTTQSTMGSGDATTTTAADTTTTAGSGSTGDVVILRLTAEWPRGDPRVDLLEEKLVAPFNASVPGFKMELYGSGELSKTIEVAEALSSGMADLAATKLTGGWISTVPELSVLGLSVFQGDAHVYAALDGELGEALSTVLETKAKVKVLDWFSAGQLDTMITTGKLVKSPADLKGVKLRVSTKMEIPAVQALGATPTIIDSSEMYLALQRGTVEGVFITTTGGAMKSKLPEVAKYWTRVPLLNGVQFGLVVSTEAWNKLPADGQQLLIDGAAAVREQLAASGKGSADKAWGEIMGMSDMQTHEVPAPEVAAWTDLIRPSQLALLGEVLSSAQAADLLKLVDAATP